MKRIQLPAQLLLLLIALVALLTFAYDLLRFYSSLEFITWSYIHEAFNILIVILFYRFLKNRPLFDEPLPQKNLKRFIIYLAILYVGIIISKTFLNPVFSFATFPRRPETIGSLVYANLATFLAIFLLLPLIVTLKNLINYRRRKYTNFYYSAVLVLSALLMVITVLEKLPLEMEFSGFNMVTFNSMLFVFTLLFLIILSFRNSWITYLSRREKRYYFLVSPVMVVLIILLFDYAFKDAVPYHSLALGVFVTIAHWFLVFYSIMASFFLLIQLPTARVFDRKMREVSSMHNLSRTISGEFNFQRLVRLVTDMCSEVIESNYTWLEMSENDGADLYVTASKNLTPSEVQMLMQQRGHEVINEQIFTTRKTFLENHLNKSSFSAPILSLKQDIGSLAGVPLLNREGRVMGILYAAKQESFGFDPDDVNMLEAYASQASIALENANLHKSSLERERMEKELQIAREVQLRLLPQDTPQSDAFEIETLTITAYEVGGDYFDFYVAGNRQTGVVIGDVSGKGTSAAFYMAEVKGIIQSLAGQYNSPRDILIHSNRILFKSIEKTSFISLLALQLDPQEGNIAFARAGHCPIIHYQAETDKTEILEPAGIAAGLEDGKIFEKYLKEYKIPMHRDDIIVLYTDGLSEARNKNDEEFGEERLCNTVKENRYLSAPELKEVIIDEILRFLEGQNLHDDLTLVLIKIK